MGKTAHRKGSKAWQEFAAANPETAEYLLRHHHGEEVIAHGTEYITVMKSVRAYHKGGTGRFTLIKVP